MDIPVKKPRLEWLDALRGFTMILVVANHVSQIGFGQHWKWSSSLPFLLLFRMPLFFFVSGFLAYKAAQVWDAHNLGQLLLKKLRVQLIPTAVFFVLFCALVCNNFADSLVSNLHSPTKGGYWFTIALLWMFVIYYLFSYAESKLLALFPKIPRGCPSRCCSSSPWASTKPASFPRYSLGRRDIRCLLSNG